MELPQAFIERMKERLGERFPAFLRVYDLPARKGLRVNELKISPEEFLARAPFPIGERVEWERSGFLFEGEKAGADPYHFAGLFYLQEPSAMAVGAAAAPLKKERVLDLCAAPGGKTTHIAAQMKGKGFLLANEIDGTRAKILSQNVERMGIVNCAVSNAEPKRLAEELPAFFDLVLVDAPCSGEGMFRKEPNALAEWSPENVLHCAARQREILESAAVLLEEGGTLVYSTCTFAEEEDEWQIESFLARHPEFSLGRMEKLYPHERAGEGHFLALLKKKSGESCRKDRYPISAIPAADKAFHAFCEDFFTRSPAGEIAALRDGRMYLVPEGTPDLHRIRLLRLGVELGEWDGKLFRPAHALAMAFGQNARRRLSLSREECDRYLRGETSESSLPDGWCVAEVEEFPLGLGKCVGGVVKNHLPKGLRKYAGSP